MDALDLLRSWPGFDRLDAAAILAHPAWRMPVGFDDDHTSIVLIPFGGAGSMTPPPRDELLLSITLDDVPGILGVADSTRYPDLHRLWSRRAELPEALVIALVEKETGVLLQAVERFTRRELRIVGLANSTSNPQLSAFQLDTPDGSLGFSLPAPPDFVDAIGILDNLDATHPSILAMTRPARAHYAAISLDAPTLKPGDYFIIPSPLSATWQVAPPSDDDFHVMSSDESTFTFEQFVNESLPAVPPPGDITVFHRGNPIFTAALAQVGDTPAIRLLSPLNI